MPTKETSVPSPLFWFMGLVVCLAACSPSGPKKKICYPVKGSLFVKGKPAEGALVTLQPKEVGNPNDWPSGFPRAHVAADGKFEVETYKEKDGAPTGEYIVLVSWEIPNPPDPRKDDPGVTDKLGRRYSNSSTSTLTAKIEAGPTELPPIRLP
jgi:hypothetical protein